MTAQTQHTHSSSFMNDIGPQLKSAAAQLVKTSNTTINGVLLSLADKIEAHSDAILKANESDIARAKDANQTAAFIDRLTLNADSVKAIAQSVRDIAALPDPVGEVLEDWDRPNGLNIQKVSVPIGVLGIIYESRPNVTIDAAALCLKSHNAALLRGGSDALDTSLCLHGFVAEALKEHDLAEAAISIISTADREHVGVMLAAHDYIDVIVPRGGRGLIERIMNEATMPVFAHLDGICHVYVDQSADIAMAASVLRNAKLRRTGICGAAETVLIDADLSNEDAKSIIQPLLNEQCVIVGDERSCALDGKIIPANHDDWTTEYLDNKISMKFVPDIDAAIGHINTCGSHHTDAIITDDKKSVQRFQNEVDSAIIMHNASTQFADGGEFGFGAEIGIGTGKLHARGPVGVRQLTTFKYLVSGNGQTRP